MRKLISSLIAVMMVFTMVPYTAFAATAIVPLSDYTDEAAPNIAASAHEVSTTDEATEILCAGMVERRSEIVLKLKITEDELTEEALNAKVTEIYDNVFNHTGEPQEGDALKWVYEECPVQLSATGDGTDFYAILTFTPTYYTTAAQEAELTAAVEQLKTELALEGKSDYEKVKAIYDYMAANISYDYDNLNNESYKLKYTAYAALINKTSVCQGYSTLFYRMACECGIDARIISGTSLNKNGGQERHSWNIVKLDGKYYDIDTTWDSTWDSDKETHDFFLKGEDSFENHIRDAEFTTSEFNTSYPMSETDYVPGANDEQIESEAHIFVEETIPATCTEGGRTQLRCIGCGKTVIKSETLPLGHHPVAIPAVAPTCDKEGLTAGVKCSVCNEIIKAQEVVPATGHTEVVIPAKPGNCSNGASTEGIKCSVCNKVLEEPQYSDTPVHTFSKTYKVVTPATMQKEGLKAIVCTKCGAVSEKSIEIPQIKSATITALVYNGSVRNPIPNIVNYYKNTKLKKGTDYTVVYKNAAGTKVVKPKNVGKYTAVITFKGQYKGTIKRTFNINPKATVINKLTKPAKKQIKVTWQKRTAQVTGYEIQYSTTKNFTKKTTKTLKVKNFKTNTKTIKNLKAKKKYWVKIRTYKNVNGKSYYSAWSKAKVITTK